MTIEHLNARDDLLELATLYEQEVSLDAIQAATGGAGVGPRTPPGVRLMLNVDELDRARGDLDDWAGWCASLVASDVGDQEMPDLTAPRLRYLAVHVDVMLEQDDAGVVDYFAHELAHHLHTFRRLAHRGEPRVPVGVECRKPGCGGQLVSNLGGFDGTDSALRCDKCGAETPFLVWRTWPRTAVQFVTPEHAARLLGTTPNAVRIRAHRGKWRRVGTGRDVRYLLTDIWGERNRA